MNYEVIEHTLDKYGFPLAIVIWMFWRDWFFITKLTSDISAALEILRIISTKLNNK
jgi:hypothetical protein